VHVILDTPPGLAVLDTPPGLAVLDTPPGLAVLDTPPGLAVLDTPPCPRQAPRPLEPLERAVQVTPAALTSAESGLTQTIA
jgi:hypothetical protein